ncbi:hypothetical protein [Cupriavidus malaysiensis]|nr:hypothetical protein [Cupriavidus malaysiensis]
MHAHIPVGIYLNAAELSALAGEGADLFHFYTFGIRAFMDLETGRVGGTGSTFSYQTMKFQTMRPARPGVGGVAHDVQKMRRMLARLVELGLLERLADTSHRLELHCIKADRVLIDQEPMEEEEPCRDL